MLVQVYEFGYECTKKIYDDITSKRKSGSNDRSGALSLQTKEEVMQKLKNYHGSILSTKHDYPWRVWASHIIAKKSAKDEIGELLKILFFFLCFFQTL